MPDAEQRAWMRKALHDLSQPVTALECGLFLGSMSPDGERPPNAEELMATIVEALGYCRILIMQVRALHEQLSEERAAFAPSTDTEILAAPE